MIQDIYHSHLMTVHLLERERKREKERERERDTTIFNTKHNTGCPQKKKAHNRILFFLAFKPL